MPGRFAVKIDGKERIVELLSVTSGAHSIALLGGFGLDVDAMWADAERFPDEE